MKTENRTIRLWLSRIDERALCLPRFQRDYVWETKHITGLLETIILKESIPIGVFLVLETDSDKPVFTPRHIDGEPVQSTCRELLLDGQQRLTALWEALHDKSEYRYYVEFDDNKLKSIRRKIMESTEDIKFSQDPKRAFKKNKFPVRLLNPLEESGVVDRWVDELSLDEDESAKVKKMIMEARENFSKRIIPYFKLPSTTKRDLAIETYERLNTNSVKLSNYYLAVAEMEKDTEQSLYDVGNRLTEYVKDIANLETDEIGELVLKIFCLIKGKTPSGSAYKKLPYNELSSKENAIFEGVEWTVNKLANLKIWRGSQLPTIVPLRVLPALHVEHKNDIDKPINNKIINRYLWHAFLTDRYSKQANQRLKEDFDDLKDFIKGAKKENSIRIFKESAPDLQAIKEANWPQGTAKSIISRGILLVCCDGGAVTLKDGMPLEKTNLDKRERHHIFPKSRIGEGGNIAINCMLIPKDENQQFSNDLPGDYIAELIRNLKTPLPETNVVEYLETHCLPKDIAKQLIQIKESNNSGGTDLKGKFEDFVEKRAGLVEEKIKILLREGNSNA